MPAICSAANQKISTARLEANFQCCKRIHPQGRKQEPGNPSISAHCIDLISSQSNHNGSQPTGNRSTARAPACEGGASKRAGGKGERTGAAEPGLVVDVGAAGVGVGEVGPVRGLDALVGLVAPTGRSRQPRPGAPQQPLASRPQARAGRLSPPVPRARAVARPPPAAAAPRLVARCRRRASNRSCRPPSRMRARVWVEVGELDEQPLDG